MTSTEAGNYELANYEYGESNGKLKKITYSNGLAVEYSYITLENLEKAWYTKGGSSTRGWYNPITYRGYYYDSDISLYTLGTRYQENI